MKRSKTHSELSARPIAILRRLVTLAQLQGAHSQVIEDSSAALDSLEVAMQEIEKRNVAITGLINRNTDLVEQIQSLELACDHHKMFWQKAEERERGLKEQLEATERALRDAAHAFAQYALDTNEPPEGAVNDFVEGFRQGASFPAKRPSDG